METYIIKLKPKGFFTKIPETNTIFGSICWAIRDLEGNEYLNQYIEKFERNPDFIISNCYEYYEKEKGTAYILPRPIPQILEKEKIEELANNFELFEDTYEKKEEREKLGILKDKFLNTDIFIKRRKLEIVNKYKKFKKIKKMEENDFIDYIEDGKNEWQLFENWIWNKENQSIISSHSYYSNIKNIIFQKNVTDRITMTVSQEGGTFYQDVKGIKNGGLYFLIKTKNIEKIFEMIKYASERGFGADKSVGNGQFEAELIKENDFLKKLKKNELKKTKIKVNLSKYIPEKEEINFESEKTIYETEIIRGVMEDRNTGKIDKPRIITIKEGSILETLKENKVYGKIHLVRKSDVTIYHYGIGFFLNVMEV